MIPTFCERENIVQLVEEILALNLGVNILIVDDNSPDGTGKIADELAKKYPQVQVLHRQGIGGRGSAGIAGLKYLLAQGADFIIEMDADFSHQPCYLPLFLEKIKEADIVIGSRFVKGGKDIGRGMRHLITLFANVYIRNVLGLKIYDCTSGYRCFRRKVLEAINLDNTVSLGPAIVQELLYKACLRGFRVVEIPVVFVERRRGKSTFNFRIMLEGFLMVLILKFLFSKIRGELTAKEIERISGGKL
ncbi:MAG: polyprenol monophosphomannose synthase [Candidatus Edwardsbacteria bacterium]